MKFLLILLTLLSYSSQAQLPFTYLMREDVKISPTDYNNWRIRMDECIICKAKYPEGSDAYKSCDATLNLGLQIEAKYLGIKKIVTEEPIQIAKAGIDTNTDPDAMSWWEELRKEFFDDNTSEDEDTDGDGILDGIQRYEEGQKYILYNQLAAIANVERHRVLKTDVAGFQSDDSNEAIEQFAHLAMEEGIERKIPPSIKLGQMILESNSGESSHALKANNYFGIKNRTGIANRVLERKTSSVHYRDDDYNKQGKLVPSPFVKFLSARECFYFHSEFLRQQKRYKPLFLCDFNDYSCWAETLHRCGYATSQTYPEDLRRIIERYRLDIFDYYSLNYDKYLKQ